MISSLRILAASPKSRKILKEKLEAKGYPDTVVQKTLSNLEEKGFLNDRVFAQGVLQSYSQYRAAGRKRVAFEMKKRGILPPMIDEVLQQYGPEEEFAKAVELVRNKKERWKKLESAKKKKKLYDFLCRRGFDFGMVRDVLDQVMREKDDA